MKIQFENSALSFSARILTRKGQISFNLWKIGPYFGIFKRKDHIASLHGDIFYLNVGRMSASLLKIK